jgi:hypothetical protein
LAPVLLSACGGGGGTASTGDGDGGGSNSTPGVFLPSEGFAAQCVAPRSDSHPISGNPWPGHHAKCSDT